MLLELGRSYTMPPRGWVEAGQGLLMQSRGTSHHEQLIVQFGGKGQGIHMIIFWSNI